jgi:hypothetical protein
MTTSLKPTGIHALQIWDRDFLDISSRRKLTGKPIWAYKVSDDELNSLKQKLKGMLAAKKPNIVIGGSMIFDKLFVLYSTTWLQRNYSGGKEKWQPLFDSLGIKDYRPFYQTSIRGAVERGLKLWGQTIFDSSRDEYFATLFCQGGFPRAILTGENEIHLRQYLVNLIEKYSLFYLSKSPYDLAKESLHDLPKSLQQKSLAELAASLLDDLIILRDEYHLYSVKDPVLELEAKKPDWKQDLKFLLADDEATELMRVLLRRAASIVKREKHPIRVSRFLREAQDGWYLEAFIHLNATISPEDLSDQLGDIDLPSFFDLYSISSSNERKLAASFNLKSSGVERWQVSRKTVNYFGELAQNELIFELWSEDNKLASGTYYRGESLSSEMPWVFAPASKGLMFVGQGAVKSKSEKAYVISSMEPVPSNLLSTVKFVGNILGSDRAVYEVYGSTKVSTIHGSFKVVTDCVTTDVVLCQIKGEIEPLALGEKTYRGLPQLFANFAGNITDVPVNELFWKGKDQAKIYSWQANNVFGQGTVIWNNNGEVLWQSSLNVVPENSQFNHNLSDDGQFEVNVVNFKNDGVALCQSQERWLRNVEPALLGQRLDIQLPNGMAAYVSVTLRWPYAGTLAFEVPTGQNGLCLISPYGRPATKHQQLCIDDLYRCSLKVVCNEDSAVWDFKINAVLMKKGRGEQPDQIKVSLNEHLRFGTIEISPVMTIDCQVLIKLANTLYAQSDDTWDFISFRVENKALGYRCDLAQIFPDRHRAIPVANENKVKEKFFISNLDQHKYPDSASLKLRPMWKLNENEVEMATVYDEQNRQAYVVPKDLEAGPWLVFADAEHKVQPTLVTIGREAVNFDETLECVVKSNNLAWLYDLLKLMEQNPTHSAWNELEVFVDSLKLVRANTFNIFIHLVNNPSMCALLLFRKSEQEWFDDIWKLQNQLPFSWLCLSLEHWRDAMDSLIARVEVNVLSLGLDVAMSQQLMMMQIEDFLEKLSSKGEGFKTVADILRYEKIGKTCDWIKYHSDDWKLEQFDSFHSAKQELFERQNGKFICRIQSARKDEEFRHELKPNLMRAVLPQKLFCLLINPNVPEHVHKNQFFMLELPVLTAYWAMGVLDSVDDFPVTYKPFSRFLQVAISRLLSEDREWVDKAYSLALQASFLISKDKAHD